MQREMDGNGQRKTRGEGQRKADGKGQRRTEKEGQRMVDGEESQRKKPKEQKCQRKARLLTQAVVRQVRDGGHLLHAGHPPVILMTVVGRGREEALVVNVLVSILTYHRRHPTSVVVCGGNLWTTNPGLVLPLVYAPLVDLSIYLCTLS